MKKYLSSSFLLLTIGLATSLQAMEKEPLGEMAAVSSEINDFQATQALPELPMEICSLILETVLVDESIIKDSPTIFEALRKIKKHVNANLTRIYCMRSIMNLSGEEILSLLMTLWKGRLANRYLVARGEGEMQELCLRGSRNECNKWVDNSNLNQEIGVFLKKAISGKVIDTFPLISRLIIENRLSQMPNMYEKTFDIIELLLFFGVSKEEIDRYKISIQLPEKKLPLLTLFRDIKRYYGIERECYFKIAKLLLNYGTNVNVKDESGQTMLYCACAWGNLPQMEFLLEHKADANIKTSQGEPCLPGFIEHYKKLDKNSDTARHLAEVIKLVLFHRALQGY